MAYAPPYTITEKSVTLIANIMELITKIDIHAKNEINPRLRRDNRIKTIQASLAIENNSLSIEQVTAIVNGKRILGPGQDIKEVQNAYEAYEQLLTLDPYDINSLLTAHKLLMNDLTKEAGKFRSAGVGVFAGDQLVHMAPPAHLVREQIEDLIKWSKSSEAHPLVKSCVFHYEFEFIHPFSDGNGRMGRMWQTLILYKWKEIFGWLPVESLIKERQELYYEVLGICDKEADSGKFIAFLLQAIFDTLSEMTQTEQATEQATEQVLKLLGVMGTEPLSTSELMKRVGIKHRPTFRDNYLLPAMQQGWVAMTIPDKPNSSKQKYRKNSEAVFRIAVVEPHRHP
jgi:Fic family protein